MSFIVPSAVNPPLHNPSPDGSRLLGILRTYEKNRSDVSLLEEAVEMMQSIVEKIRRRGLLQGDAEAAERVLSSSSARSQLDKQGSKRGGKRGRSTDLTSDNLVLHSGDTESSKMSDITFDGQLIVQSIIRLLSGIQDSGYGDASGKDDSGGSVLLVALAAELCTCICDSILSRSAMDTCTVAEYELIAASGKQILGNLDTSAASLLMELCSNQHVQRNTALKEECCHALKECLLACSSLISLFGTKLSRSAKLLSSLRKLAWKSLSVSSSLDSVVHAAAMLIATLPFAGGTDNLTPSDLWNRTLEDVVTCASRTLADVVPRLGQRESGQKKKLSDTVEENIEEYRKKLERIESQIERADSIIQRLGALVLVVSNLLSCDGVGKRTDGLLHSCIDVDGFLSLVEAMLSVPLAAETSFHSTKKRLRSEPLDGGLLGPMVLVQKVANQTKIFGCDLVISLLASVGGPTLLPYARRIVRITHASLLTASSSNVRRTIDPTSEAQFSGKRQRWLQQSLVMRSRAIEVFRASILAFGYDPLPRSSRDTASRSDNMEKSVNLVCGSLLEEIATRKNPEQEGIEWGSPSERANLVAAASNCLSSTLTAGGEYLSLDLRNLVDSTVLILLASVTDDEVGGYLSLFPIIKSSFLNLGCVCVETPWQDGAASSVAESLVNASRFCLEDADLQVVQAAKAALRVCESLSCSRSPALAICSRPNERIPRPADEMLEQLARVQDDIDKQRETRKAEAQAKRLKDKEQTGQNESKRHKSLPEGKQPLPPPVAEGSKQELFQRHLQRSDEAKVEKHPDNRPTTEKEDIATFDEPSKTKSSSTKAQENHDSDGDDFPMIFDCGPDHEDK